MFLIQHNCILSRLVAYKKHVTSVAKDLILVRNQPLNKIIKIQILGCKYFLLFSLNFFDIINYLYSFICILLSIFILLIISYCIIIHPRICIFVMMGKGLVSREGASCAAGVVCFFIYYSYTANFVEITDIAEYPEFVEITNVVDISKFVEMVKIAENAQNAVLLKFSMLPSLLRFPILDIAETHEIFKIAEFAHLAGCTDIADLDNFLQTNELVDTA